MQKTMMSDILAGLSIINYTCLYSIYLQCWLFISNVTSLHTKGMQIIIIKLIYLSQKNYRISKEYNDHRYVTQNNMSEIIIVILGLQFKTRRDGQMN